MIKIKINKTVPTMIYVRIRMEDYFVVKISQYYEVTLFFSHKIGIAATSMRGSKHARKQYTIFRCYSWDTIR